MSFPKLTFPLTVDFANAGYWIGDRGPYKYGAAITAFFIGDDLTDGVKDRTRPLAVHRMNHQRPLLCYGAADFE